MMDEHSSNLLDEMMKDAGAGVHEMSDRDMACFILDRLNYESQLTAISDLLRRNCAADKSVAAEMKEREEYARKNGGWQDDREAAEFGECFHVSVYQSAAHSMAALGMIAPLLESIFFQAFQGIRAQFFGSKAIPPGHVRSDMTDPDRFWDCHNLFSAKAQKDEKNLVPGIEQLSEAVGLTPHLPATLHGTLEALFGYRNKMFHHGFEWPKSECEKFAKRIEQDKWQPWFSRAELGHEPWIFYMTDDFINHCREMVDKVLDSFGAYCKGRHPVATSVIKKTT